MFKSIITKVKAWFAEKTVADDFKKVFGVSDEEAAKGLDDFFKGYLEVTKQYIKEQVSKDLEGTEKKAAVDKAVCDYIDSKFKDCKNIMLLALISYAKDKLVPTVTQTIYNLLKEKVDNL